MVVVGLVDGNLRAPSRKAAGRRCKRRTLRLEPLENRSLLSANVLGTISGVAFYDPTGAGLTAGDTRLSGVTVELYSPAPAASSTTASATPWSAPPRPMPPASTASPACRPGTTSSSSCPPPATCWAGAKNVAPVTITAAELAGVTGVVIDSFSTTTQTAGAAYPSGTTGSSYSTATDAVGGARDMFVQLTSAHGSVSLGADSTTPDALDFSTSFGAVGIGQITWQGQATGAWATAPGLMRNPTGLNHLDLTSAGASTGIEPTLGADHAGTAVLTIYTNGGDSSSATIAIPDPTNGATTQQVFVPFSSFATAAGSGADFTNVGAIQLVLSGPAAMDAEVANIDAVGPAVITHNFANTAQTDLAIVKTGTPSPVVAGTQLTYTFTSTNDGPSAATGVYFIDTLPAGLTYVSSTTSQGTASFANGVLTVTLGNMASGATATTTVLVNVNPSARGTITNTAVITGNEPDPNLTNNTSTVNTPIDPEVNLAILKSGTPNPVTAGKTLTYTLTVTNNGPSNGTGVSVTDTLPAGVTYSSSTTTQGGTRRQLGSTVTAALGNLATGALRDHHHPGQRQFVHQRRHHQHRHRHRRRTRSQPDQ